MLKVLILDDDRINNDLNATVLKLAGVTEIDVRVTGIGALQYLEECKVKKEFPGIMFVDINMPGMNGFAFIREYEKNFRKFSPSTCIVLLTNSLRHEDKIIASRYESVIEYLTKPLTIKKVIEVFKKVKIEI
jgi:CheY-like chemotaxis protein